jgi:NADPH:quinone reductase-like Zn-dependent oxidoreductase
MALLLKVAVVSRFVRRQQLRYVMASITPENLETLSTLVTSGDVVPLIDRTYALSETPAAVGYVEEGHARGKVIVTV